MNAARWCGLVGLSFLLVSCGSSKKSSHSEAMVPSRFDKQYLAAFCKPAGGLAGIGFSPLGRYSSDPSYAQAAEVACRHLAWFTHVRVKGERVYQQMPDGSLEYRGEHIELLDLPEITPESCALDTFDIAGHGWIVATQDGAASVGGRQKFPQERPFWLSQTPSGGDWYYAVGTAQISFKDEAGSWDLATYNALVEVAMSVSTRTGALGKTAAEIAGGGTLLEVDTELQNFRVVGRWRDRRNAYVLGRVGVADAIPHLVLTD